MRLTTATFTREYQSNGAFFFGSYKLIEPFDEQKGTIYWFSDGSTEPIVSTYTWDGELLVLFWTATSTGHVYPETELKLRCLLYVQLIKSVDDTHLREKR